MGNPGADLTPPGHGVLRCPAAGHELSAAWIQTPAGGRGRWGWLSCACADFPVVDDIPIMFEQQVTAHGDAIGGGLTDGTRTADLVDLLHGDDPLAALVALLAVPIGPWPLTRSEALRDRMRQGPLARATSSLNGLRVRRMLGRRDQTTFRDWLTVFHLQAPMPGDVFNHQLHRFSQPRHLAGLALTEGLPPGPALDLACGAGHVAHTLEQAGHP